MTRRRRKPAALLVDPVLLAEARAAGVDISRVVEDGLRQRIIEAEAWRRENAAALESWNAWVEKHGLPLEKYRQF